MKDLGVNVISTEMDLVLFTDIKYQNKVYKAVNDIRRNHNVTEKDAVACYKDCIVLYDQQKHIIAIKEF